MKQLPLVHVGMAKAASTFLQFEVFPKLPGLHNLGKHHVPDEMKKAGLGLVRRTSIDWDEQTCGQPFRDALATAHQQNLRAVYSEEDLSVFKFLDPETMALRLRAIFGAYDVLLIIRDPVSWVRSQYLFRLQHQNPIAAMGFEEWLSTHLANRRIGSDIMEIWFGALAARYRAICGGTVHILPYELLRSDKVAFARHLAEILAVDETETASVITAGPNSMRHKVGITVAKQKFFELFRWVVLRQPDRAGAEIENYCAAQGIKLAPGLSAELDALVKAGNADHKNWAALFHAIGRRFPGAETAKPDIPEAQLAQLDRIRRRELRRLKAEFGFDPARFGVHYD